MVYNKMIKVNFDSECCELLDDQSRKLNWTYNKLLSIWKEDYENGNIHKFLTGRNMRNYMVNTVKPENPFLYEVFAHVLQEVPKRLKKAYEKAINEGTGFPKYRSWSKKWFSLVYDDLSGWKLDGYILELSMGLSGKEYKSQQITEVGKNIHIKGTLSESLSLKDGERFKQLHIIKKKNNFYAMFVIEADKSEAEKEFEQQLADYKQALIDYRISIKQEKEKASEAFDNGDLDYVMQEFEKPIKPVKPNIIPDGVKWISLDPNHKNFFTGIDYEGKTIEFSKLDVIRYWDSRIDELKSKRDKCIKNYKKKETQYGNKYTIHSPRWNRLNRALDKCYQRRDGQIKKILYIIAHYLYSRYDLVIIGDYVPNTNTSKYDTMHRSMLNQTVIGKLRKTVEWVALKEGKYYIKQDERDTTKTCCMCGYQEKKDPDVREFICPVCKNKILRDVNSAINIAAKAGYRPENYDNIDTLNTIKKMRYNSNIA